MKKEPEKISVIDAFLLGMALASAIIGLCLMSSCSPAEKRSATEYAILIDETDSTHSVPDTAAVAADLGIDTNIWNGVEFTLSRVIDVSYTPRTRIVFAPGGSRITSSQYTRKREVEAFKKRLSELLDSVRNDTSGKPHSSIYLPMAEELARLASSTADRKVLVVYSDLRENRPGLSFYDPRTAALLASDPEKIEARLLALSPLPDLVGIEVRLIYQPRDAKDDASFRLASGFFKCMLEKQGATVTVSANLTN